MIMVEGTSCVRHTAVAYLIVVCEEHRKQYQLLTFRINNKRNGLIRV